jgi:hypothetical protein
MGGMMSLSNTLANQIAYLLNLQNDLMVHYTTAKILEHDDSYVVRLNDEGRLLGVVEVNNVQWLAELFVMRGR